eukprot:m51a1_g1734 hypothetical protein (300) ;mRNA; f:160137-161210
MRRLPLWHAIYGVACLCSATLFLTSAVPALQDCALLRSYDMESRARAVPRDPAEWPFILAHLYCGVPTSFIRYGDGEFMLISGRSVGSPPTDRWTWPGGPSLLGDDIRQSLAEPPRGIEHYAALGCFTWISNFSPYVKVPTRYLSTATAFINENYAAFKEELARWTRAFTRETSPFIIVGNAGCNASRALQWAHDFVALPDEGPVLWQSLRQVFLSQFEALARAHSGRVFLLSGGPLAKAIAYHMALANTNNSYIDMGSALDEHLKGIRTRHYQKLLHDRPACKSYTRDPDTGKIHYVE